MNAPALRLDNLNQSEEGHFYIPDISVGRASASASRSVKPKVQIHPHPKRLESDVRDTNWTIYLFKVYLWFLSAIKAETIATANTFDAY